MMSFSAFTSVAWMKAGALGARMHHVSSIAVSGEYEGNFREDMFDEGQPLKHPYHRTKFEAERIVRTDATVPWRVYRPAIVVGDSRTGEMDKIDGPYYFFKAIQKARGALPAWFPLIGPELGDTNVVPVDYVAAAIDHIAHVDGLDRQAFHIANPKPQSSGDVLNAFANAANAPQFAMRVDSDLLSALPKGAFGMAMQLPAAKGVRKAILADLGIPDEVIGYVGLKAQYDTRDADRLLADAGIEEAS
jgi:thioester reductase-like protein